MCAGSKQINFDSVLLVADDRAGPNYRTQASSNFDMSSNAAVTRIADVARWSAEHVLPRTASRTIEATVSGRSDRVEPELWAGGTRPRGK